MKKKLSILLICILCFILVGCGSSDFMSNLKDSDTIMVLSTSGGGLMSQEQMEASKNSYSITYGGSITDKNGIKKQMSESDVSIMRDYFIKFSNRNIKTEENEILDGPTYKLMVRDFVHDYSDTRSVGAMYYEWSYNKQDEYVHELTNIVQKYFD